MIDKYKIPADKRAGFVLLWAAGQQQFAAAEKSKAPADYQTAADTLQSALKSPEANSLAGPASRCRYTLAWCHYRQGEFEAAAREFTTALTGLEAARDALAVESAWMAFASYRRARRVATSLAAHATEALKRIERSFPDHPYAKRAEYEMARLLDKSDPEALASQLESIPESDANYAQARYRPVSAPPPAVVAAAQRTHRQALTRLHDAARCRQRFSAHGAGRGRSLAGRQMLLAGRRRGSAQRRAATGQCPGDPGQGCTARREVARRRSARDGISLPVARAGHGPRTTRSSVASRRSG